MKKYFFVSDIHSFYTPLKKALKKKGFNKNNKNHILVVLGDVFDRGNETLEVYNFLKSIPDDRLILVKGNHESLYEELLKSDFPSKYDFKNGTVKTFCSIANIDQKFLDTSYWHISNVISSMDDGEIVDIHSKVMEYWKIVVDEVKNSEVTKWIQSKKWINYLETDKYIMVHSWIPVGCFDGLPAYYIENRNFEYRDDWRNATQTEWDDATWVCPWSCAKQGLNKTGKTIVCGHWHTSDFFNNLTKRKKDRYDCPIFKSKKYKLIGLDACTAASFKVNVLVLNEDEL